MTHLPAVLLVSSATVALFSYGCASATPTVRAAQVQNQQCDGSALASNDEQVLKSTTVLKVAPLYGHVHTSYNDYEARVNGATIYVQPPAGVDADQMTRILQCHNARVVLGQVAQADAANDPYTLPNGWVDIDVKREMGTYAVTISADSVHNGLEVLARAHAYADSRTPAVNSNQP